MSPTLHLRSHERRCLFEFTSERWEPCRVHLKWLPVGTVRLWGTGSNRHWDWKGGMGVICDGLMEKNVTHLSNITYIRMERKPRIGFWRTSVIAVTSQIFLSLTGDNLRQPLSPLLTTGSREPLEEMNTLKNRHLIQRYVDQWRRFNEIPPPIVAMFHWPNKWEGFWLGR